MHSSLLCTRAQETFTVVLYPSHQTVHSGLSCRFALSRVLTLRLRTQQPAFAPDYNTFAILARDALETCPCFAHGLLPGQVDVLQNTSDNQDASATHGIGMHASSISSLQFATCKNISLKSC